jgi:hypothetical protein
MNDLIHELDDYSAFSAKDKPDMISVSQIFILQTRKITSWQNPLVP